jgi:hypothetical protein
MRIIQKNKISVAKSLTNTAKDEPEISKQEKKEENKSATNKE